MMMTRKVLLLALLAFSMYACVAEAHSYSEIGARKLMQADLGAQIQEAALGEAGSTLAGYFCPYGSSSDFVDYLDENANFLGEEGSPLSVLLFTFVGIGAESLYRQNAANFGLRGC